GLTDATRVVIGDAQGQATIENNDKANLSINDISAGEGGVFTFTITSDKVASQDLTIVVNTANGTATLVGLDYTQLTDVAATITAGSTSTTVTVTVNDDAIVENNETFVLNLTDAKFNGLTDATRVVIGDAQGQATIQNDDTATLTLVATDASKVEGTGGGTAPFTFTVTLSADVQGGVDVAYTTDDGTGTAADSDYTNNDSTLSFTGTSGEIKTITVLVNRDSQVEADETFTVVLGTVTPAQASVAAFQTQGGPATGMILNDDAAVFSFEANPQAAEGSSVPFKIRLSNPVDVATSVLVTTYDSTAKVTDSDYVPLTDHLVTFALGVTEMAINILTTSDNKVETDELFNLQMANLDNGGRDVTISPADFVVGKIINDDSAVVTITGLAPSEGNSGVMAALGLFEISLTNAVKGAMTVDKPVTVKISTTSGTATPGTDYTDLTLQTVTFAPGESTKTVQIQVLGDLTVEANETLTGTISNLSTTYPTGVTMSPTTAVTSTIANDDAATLTVSNVTHDEGHAGLTTYSFDVTLSHQVQGGFRVPVQTQDGTASWSEGDYDTASQSILFAGAKDEVQTFSVTVHGDTTVEANERFQVVLGTLTGIDSVAAGAIARSNGTGTIANDDAATLTLAPIVAHQVEGTGEVTTAFTFRVTLSAAVEDGLNVAYTTENGTATVADGDYVDNDGGLHFDGTAGESYIITVLVNQDSKVEADETFTVALGAVTPLGAGVDAEDISELGSPATGTIVNDDTATLTIVAPAITESNADQTVYFTVTLNQAVQSGLQVDFSHAAGTANASDYQVTTARPLTFTGGAGESHTIAVIVKGDQVVEDNETFTISLGAVTPLEAGVLAANISTSGSPATSTIVNDDKALFSINSVSQNEGHSGLTPFTFTVTLSHPSQWPVTVDYATAEGSAHNTAVLDHDYNSVSGTLTFLPGGSLTQTITVNVEGDTTVENDEDFTLTLSNPLYHGASDTSRADLAPAYIGTGTIANDDTATLAITSPSITEGNSGTTTLTFHVSVDLAVEGGFTVAFHSAGVTATAGSDYTVSTGSPLTFAGTAGETRTVAVTIYGDQTVEADERFTITLGTVTPVAPVLAAAIGTGAIGTGTITNDDVAEFTVERNINVAESSIATFTILLSNPIDVATSVTASTRDGTAKTADNDYTAVLGRLLTFAAGQISTTIDVQTTTDSKVELDETFDVFLSDLNAGGRSVTIKPDRDFATAKILNDDVAVVAIDSVTQNENTGAMVFTVSLSHPVDVPVSVTATTTNATAATADSD
ncbi:MAG: hypothetical protein NTY19_21320, partial [Planctomycetota bacterium]|nr:hypothetical protein [Planctomycetota bacterium]